MIAVSVGFIRDKLEIKFLILYVTSRVIEPLPLSQVQELTMIDDGIDYFAFSECLNDLVRTEHLRLTENEQYAITAKGIKNSGICETSLPYSIRMKADKAIAACNREILRRSQVQGKVIPRENGTFTVELSLSDDVDNVMDLKLMVASREMAEDLAKRFEENPEKIYSKMVTALYDSEK